MDSKLALLLQACKPAETYKGVHLPTPHHPNSPKSHSPKVLDSSQIESSIFNSINSMPSFLPLNAVDIGNCKNYMSNQFQLPLVQLGPGGPIGSILQTHVFRPLTIFPESVGLNLLPNDEFGRLRKSPTHQTCNSGLSAFQPFGSSVYSYSSDVKKPIPLSHHSGNSAFTTKSESSSIPTPLPFDISSSSSTSAYVSPPSSPTETANSSTPSLHIPVVSSPYILASSAATSASYKQQPMTSSLFIPTFTPPISSFQSISPRNSGTGSPNEMKKLANPNHNNLKLKRLKRRDKVHTCDHPGCGFSFPTRFSLKRHQKRHTGEKPFLCNWVENGEPCGTRFAEKSTLKRHLQTHTGEKPFKCSRPGCDRVFADRLNCHRHERRHRSAWIPTSQL